MRGKVVTEDTAGICETIRILRRRGIQEDANGFLRLRAKDYDTGIHFVGLARVAVNVENCTGAVAVGVHQDFVGHGVRNELAVAGGDGVSDGGERGVEIGMRHAAAFAGTAKWQGPRPLMGLVRLAERVGIMVRPSFSLTRLRKRVSWQVSGTAG